MVAPIPGVSIGWRKVGRVCLEALVNAGGCRRRKCFEELRRWCLGGEEGSGGFYTEFVSLRQVVNGGEEDRRGRNFTTRKAVSCALGDDRSPDGRYVNNCK